ncbi:MAG: ribosome silencing factor [Rhodothermales bacterium]|nr:ribosome silencing factor [Rhodothermales bacterium]
MIPRRTSDKKRATSASVRKLARLAVDGILEKKGHDTVVLDVHSVSGVADIFIVTTGDSDLQVKAIVESVRSTIRENEGERPWHVEGTDHMQWVLLDYVDLVVHVFLPEKRQFYDLERLWGDAPRAEVPDDAPSSEGISLIAGD